MPSGAGYKNMIPVFPEIQEIQKENIITKDALIKLIAMVKGSDYHIVSNCEDVTDWDISNSGVFNAVNEVTDKRVGSNAIELVDIGSTKGDFVTLDDVHRPENEDWSEMNWLCLWIHDDTALRLAGELTIQIRNNKEWGAEIDVPLCQTVNMFEYKCINIQSLARSRVDGFRFVNQRGSGGSEKVYADEIIVTNVITGVGDGVKATTGPILAGKIVPLPVKTGETITPGETVEWDVMGIAAGTDSDPRVIGIACQFEAIDSVIATDTEPKDAWVAIQGIFLLRNNGTGLVIGATGLVASDVITAGVGTGTAAAENDMCVSLETSTTAEWKSGDSAYRLKPAPGLEAV